MRKALLMVAVGIVFGVIVGRFTAPVPAAADAPVGNGDVNADGKVDVSDGIYIINYVFRGGPLPVPISCPPSRLPATGQTTCYNADGAEIACDSADFPGQDAFYQAGCPTAGRFADNQDGTVTDNCTGLMWQKETVDVNEDGEIGTEFGAADRVTWWEALEYCDLLSFAGHNDWRLPNVRELQSILDYGRSDPAIDPAFEAASFWYWSSSPLVGISVNAYGVNFSYGYTVNVGVGDLHCLVRAVRTAQ